MADYRYITLASETMEWTARDGCTPLTVTVALVEEQWDTIGRGEYHRRSMGITYRATVGGTDQGVLGGIQSVATGDLAASIGRIGLDVSRAAALHALVARVESHPEWIALRTRRAASTARHEQVDADAAALDRAMHASDDRRAAR